MRKGLSNLCWVALVDDAVAISGLYWRDEGCKASHATGQPPPGAHGRARHVLAWFWRLVPVVAVYDNSRGDSAKHDSYTTRCRSTPGDTWRICGVLHPPNRTPNKRATCISFLKKNKSYEQACFKLVTLSRNRTW